MRKLLCDKFSKNMRTGRSKMCKISKCFCLLAMAFITTVSVSAESSPTQHFVKLVKSGFDTQDAASNKNIDPHDLEFYTELEKYNTPIEEQADINKKFSELQNRFNILSSIVTIKNEAQEVFNRNITEQLEVYRSQIEMQNENIKQISAYKSQLDYQKSFNHKITEQLAAYKIRMQSQEASIKKMTEQLEVNKYGKDTPDPSSDSQIDYQKSFNNKITDQLAAFKIRMQSQESSIKKITEQVEINKYRIDTHDHQYRLVEKHDACIKNITEELEVYKSRIDEKIENNKSINEKKKIATFGGHSLQNSTGIHQMNIPGIPPFNVFSDSSLASPGWTVIMRRVDNSVDFDRDWRDYKSGFGNISGNYWIGLEQIHQMTTEHHELYIHMENFADEIKYARYSSFAIASEQNQYMLKPLGEYSGTAGDAMRSQQKMKFTTRDRDNTKNKVNCARKNGNGGWWYRYCAHCMITRRYVAPHKKGGFAYTMFWKDPRHIIKFVQMMIRPVSEPLNTLNDLVVASP